MATERAIAMRRQHATERAEAAFSTIAARFGLELPERPRLAAQPDLAAVQREEWRADVWERIVAAVGTADAEHATAAGADPTLLEGSVADVKGQILEMTDLPVLRLLRSAEAGADKPRTSLLSAMDKRIADLEAEAAEAEESDDEQEPAEAEE